MASPARAVCVSPGQSWPAPPAACGFGLARQGQGAPEPAARVPTRPARASPGLVFGAPGPLGGKGPVGCDLAAGRRNQPVVPAPRKELTQPASLPSAAKVRVQELGTPPVAALSQQRPEL